MRRFGHNGPLWRGIASPFVSRIGASRRRTVLSGPALMICILAAVSITTLLLVPPILKIRTITNLQISALCSGYRISGMSSRKSSVRRGRRIGVDEVQSKSGNVCAFFWVPSNGFRLVSIIGTRATKHCFGIGCR